MAEYGTVVANFKRDTIYIDNVLINTIEVVDKNEDELIIDFSEYIQEKLTTDFATDIHIILIHFDISVMSVGKVINKFLLIYSNAEKLLEKTQILGKEV
ncbi:10670_t:CDS:2 [Diversispora eburnea]|uniref:10670_t:CDS:1 n=1 Tax=Diversispora eburnea TaxID=1213867 RepID=A0A9N8VXR5_9GLOM|nr:10670_t:CDS:2 [Diversispora eburnea]